MEVEATQFLGGRIMLCQQRTRSQTTQASRLGDRELDMGVAPSFGLRGAHTVAGTCIAASQITRLRAVSAPRGDLRLRFWAGRVHKATAVVQLGSGLSLVSFYGYNGTLRGRNPLDLVAHAAAVLPAIPPGPAVWAGDCNIITPEHTAAALTDRLAAPPASPMH